MEPEEGKFDFALVDAQIQQARKRNMRLVLIWFGSWKNGDINLRASLGESEYQTLPCSTKEATRQRTPFHVF